MDRIPDPKDLRGAAAVARSLAYVIGLVGVVGGAIVYRADGVGLAVAIWVVTFAGGAVLMIAGFLADGMAVLLARTTMLEQELRTLRRTPPGSEEDEPPWTGHPNPW